MKWNVIKWKKKLKNGRLDKKRKTLKNRRKFSTIMKKKSEQLN